MSRVDGPLSAITEGLQKATDNLAATVQVGESKLADVARRLGVDADRLRAANPHLSDTTELKVGQEICLPHKGQPGTQEPEDAPGSEGAPASGLPRAPIGDPLEKIAFQARAETTPTMFGPGVGLRGDVSDGSKSATIQAGAVYVQGFPPKELPYLEVSGEDSKGGKKELGVNKNNDL